MPDLQPMADSLRRDEPYDRRVADVPELDIREVLRIAAERWRIIAAAGMIGLLLGLVAALLTTPLYRTTALLSYDPEATDSLEQTGDGSRFKHYLASQEVMATQLGLLESDSLARRTAVDLRLPDDPAFAGGGSYAQRLDRATAFVRGGLGADAVKNSLLIRLSFTSTDPQTAARIANAVARNFIASGLERRYNSSSYARKFLSDQLESTRRALEVSERALNDYAISSSLFRIPGEVVNGRATEDRTLSNSDLTALETALNDARVKRIAAESALAGNAGAVPADAQSATSALVQQRAALQADYARNSRLFKPDYPQMRQLQAQIDRLDAAIAATRGRSGSEQGSQLKSAFSAARQAETAIEQRVAQVKRQIQGELTRSIRYNILQREADTNRTLYNGLLQRFKEVGVAGGIAQSNLSLVDPAGIPAGPYRPNVLLDCIVGLIFGVALGTGAAFVVHLLLDAIIDGDDLRAKLRLPVLGIIPRERDQASLDQMLANPRSKLNEAYFSTLTAIRSLRRGAGPHVLFITSPRPAEGKSTSASAIATNTARLGLRVLLIDADLRKPTVQADPAEQRGFAHLLASGDGLVDIVQPTEIETLSVLPVGTVTGTPAELLSSMRLAIVIEEARRAFDLVVLDGPPVLGLADAPLLCAVADSTVVIIESRGTRTASARDMIRRLSDAGGSILGVILTKVTRAGQGYGYRYDYYTYDRGQRGLLRRLDPRQWLRRSGRPR